MAVKYEMIVRAYNSHGHYTEWRFNPKQPKLDLLLEGIVVQEDDTVRVSFDIAISRER